MIKQLVLASILWGINVIVMKEMAQYIAPLFLANLRLGLLCVLLFCLCIYKKQRIQLHINLQMIFIAFFAIFCNFLFTFLAIEFVSGASLASMNGLLPIITLLLLKDRWDATYHTLSFIAIFISLVFSIQDLNFGYLLMLLSVICSAIGNVLIQRKSVLNNRFSFCFEYYFIGTIFITFLNFFVLDFHLISLKNIPILWWIVFLSVSGIGFCYIQLITLKAIRSIGSVATSYYLGFNPIVTSLLAFIIYQDSSFKQIISCLFLVMSIFFGRKANLKKNE